MLPDGAGKAVPGTRAAVISKPSGTWAHPLGADKVGRDILSRVIFPNVLNSLVAIANLHVGFVIILQSILSCLGAGIPRPTPAWSFMVADGRELVTSESGWWVSSLA